MNKKCFSITSNVRKSIDFKHLFMLDFVHCAGNTILFRYGVGFDIILHYLSEEDEYS